MLLDSTKEFYTPSLMKKGRNEKMLLSCIVWNVFWGWAKSHWILKNQVISASAASIFTALYF